MKNRKTFRALLIVALSILFISPIVPIAETLHPGAPAQDQSSLFPDDLKDLSPEMTQIIGSTASPRSLAKNITVLRQTGGRVSWSPKGDLLLIDQKGADGFYDLYLTLPDGTGEECLTCDTGGVLSSGHQGTAEWHPSGDYIVFQSQKRQTTKNWGKNIAAQPGFGRYMDLWLMEVDTRRFHQLTHTADTDDTGVLHPHFSHDGARLTWSEMYEKPKMLKKASQAGYWKLKAADFSFHNGVPQLSNEQAFEPGGPDLYENHGLSPDQSKILFTGTFESKKALDFFTTANIYQYDMKSNKLEKLSREKYNEHAHYSPDHKKILWMTSMENPNKGTDYWMMNPDGSGKTRITDFNNPELTTFRGKMVVAADSSFNPDGTKLVAYLQLNLLSQEGPIVLIELDSDESAGNEKRYDETSPRTLTVPLRPYSYYLKHRYPIAHL